MQGKITQFKQFVKTNSKVRILLTIYFVALICGIILSFLGFFISFLTVCLPLFGNTACGTVGGYILVFINIPGYIVAALLLANASTTPELLSLAMVGAISIATYYSLGKLLDRSKTKVVRATLSRSNSSDQSIIKGILIAVLVLLSFFVYLSLRLTL